MTEYRMDSDQDSPIELRLSSNFIEKSVSAPSTPTETTKLPHSRSVHFQTRKGRRVCFPNDDMIVTGYFDAPDPWSQVSELNTDGLVAAYQIACKKQGTKPLQIIIQQLQEITSFEERHEEFSLRGLRLDHRHCEALEEIFKKIQFVRLSFEACNLDDEGAAALFDMIEYYESAKQLNISFNKHIDSRGWQACSRMLKKTPCMEYLDARNTPLNEQSLLILGRALRLGAHLVTLHLENCGVCGRSLVVLVAAIKLNTTLKELFLSDNKISSSDGLQIGNLLRTNTYLETLDLRSNNLQDSGTIQISEGLCDQPDGPGNGLKSLILWNNHVSHNAMSSLGRFLFVKKLTTLNIGHNAITDDGIHELKQGLITSPVLTHLGLQNAKITCEGAVALAEYIADSKTVSCINLLGNKIRVAGLLALVRSTKHNHTVTRLDLSGSLRKDFESDEEFEEHQKLLKELDECCKRNKIAKEKSEREKEALEQEREAVFSALPNGISSESSPDPVSVSLNSTKNITSFESYFEASKSSMVKQLSVPSLEMKDMNSSMISSALGSPRNRFKVSRVFLEKDGENASCKVLSSSAPPDMTSNFIQTSLENLKSSISLLNGVVTQEPEPATRKQTTFDMPNAFEEVINKLPGADAEISATWDGEEKLQDDKENPMPKVEKGEAQRPTKTSGSILKESRSFSQEEEPESKMSRKNSKKLMFHLPNLPGSQTCPGKIKDRRMSTPAMPVTTRLQCRPNPMKLCKHLESLDLRSSVPLSPTRLMQGWVFPEPSLEISLSPKQENKCSMGAANEISFS